VDELGREVITVPMVLRLGSEGFPFLLFHYKSGLFTIPTLIGFPPPDRKLRDWLIVTSSDRGDAQKTLHAFHIFSLITVTQSELETIASDKKGDYLPTVNRITYQWHCSYTQATSSQKTMRPRQLRGAIWSAVIARHEEVGIHFPRGYDHRPIV